MITEKGRVVYERETHYFSEKDIARIIIKMADSKDWAERGRVIAKIQIEMFLNFEATQVDQIRFLMGSIIPVAQFMGMVMDSLIDRLNAAWNLIVDAGTQTEWYV